MSDKLNRRGLLKKAALVTGGAVLAASHEENALMAQEGSGSSKPTGPASAAGFPQGKLGNMQVSRLICGGNLISGFAHSRDLIYVSDLLQKYFTDEKVHETLAVCEEQGINTAILRVNDHTIRIITKYWDELGGKMQWIAQAKIPAKDPHLDINRAVDAGAQAVYVHGGVGDSCVQSGQIDVVAEALEYIKQQGVVAGVAGHMLATVKAYEEANLNPDFYMKTINSKSYWSAGIMPRHDSVWSETPEDTVKFMEKLEKPWIGYKVLGAGAIKPAEGFRYAYESGADFICAGMFDFQVVEDVITAKGILAGKLNRSRAWCS